ncbi:MAG: hypothetical protein EB059_10920 [Alphaproteobacteria bacterium]|nr:hypothetical protein [Alphaproteobacteria bacterium]
MIRVLGGPLAGNPDLWQQIVVFLSAASMLVGAIAALRQTNIKRLLAFSSIGHMGFVLLGIACVSQEGAAALVSYMMIYLIMSIAAFACVMAMRREGKWVENISDLSGLSKTHPVLALCFLVTLFSMAGIPPLAGFFAKFYVIVAALHSKLYILSTIAVLSSVISAYYYLYIVKLMYFDDADKPLDRYVGLELRWITILASTAMVLYIVLPDSVTLASARAAAMIIGAM